MLTYRRLEAMGRLGNQLWEIAGTLGRAWRRDVPARFPQWRYQPYFNVDDEWFVNDVPTGPGVEDLSDGHLQDLANFEDHAGRVRHHLRPSEQVRRELPRRYPWFYELAERTALHVRHGDYLALLTRYPVLAIGYYEAAIHSVRTAHPGTDFVVFSDDIDWCRRYLPRDLVFVDPRGAPHDHWELFLMTDCHHHVIANSSFSWWGAFLSDDADVRHPSVWYGPRRAGVPWRRMIPAGWVEVPAMPVR